jgi:hypothetical protein
MSQGTISSDINKNICEAFGCFADATIKIEVKVGQQKAITLELWVVNIKVFFSLMTSANNSGK